MDKGDRHYKVNMLKVKYAPPVYNIALFLGISWKSQNLSDLCLSLCSYQNRNTKIVSEADTVLQVHECWTR